MITKQQIEKAWNNTSNCGRGMRLSDFFDELDKVTGSEHPIENCLSHSLRIWEMDKTWKLYYNSGHCIVLDVAATSLGSFLPAESFGYNYFASAFKELLSEKDIALLKEYFSK